MATTSFQIPSTGPEKNQSEKRKPREILSTYDPVSFIPKPPHKRLRCTMPPDGGVRKIEPLLFCEEILIEWNSVAQTWLIRYNDTPEIRTLSDRSIDRRF